MPTPRALHAPGSRALPFRPRPAGLYLRLRAPLADRPGFEPFPALREVERGTADPTYLYYALGRMQILKLREDYRRHLEAQGKPYVLKDFHDRFLRLGLPVALARGVLIPGDTAPSLE